LTYRPTNTQYFEHHFIDTVSLRRVSALKGLSSGITTDTFQQQGQHNELPNVHFSLVNCLVNVGGADPETCYIFVDLAVVMCLS